MKKETVLFAVKKGEPDWAEQVITNRLHKIKEAKEWAVENGFDRLRVAEIDMETPPDFLSAVKKRTLNTIVSCQ